MEVCTKDCTGLTKSKVSSLAYASHGYILLGFQPYLDRQGGTNHGKQQTPNPTLRVQIPEPEPPLNPKP